MKSLVEIEERLAEVEADRALLVLERHVQVELEVVRQHLVGLLGEIVVTRELIALTLAFRCLLFVVVDGQGRAKSRSPVEADIRGLWVGQVRAPVVERAMADEGQAVA